MIVSQLIFVFPACFQFFFQCVNTAARIIELITKGENVAALVDVQAKVNCDKGIPLGFARICAVRLIAQIIDSLWAQTVNIVQRNSACAPDRQEIAR